MTLKGACLVYSCDGAFGVVQTRGRGGVKALHAAARRATAATAMATATATATDKGGGRARRIPLFVPRFPLRLLCPVISPFSPTAMLACCICV